MKIGPVHLIRDGTFRKLHALQDLWAQFSSALAAAARGGNRLADRVLDHTHGLMHSPLCAKLAPAWLPADPPPNDAAGRAAAERVTAAYRLALRDAAAPPTPSMWDGITAEKREFLAALELGKTPAVHATLARMFATQLTRGLGQTHPSHVDLLRGGGPSHLHVRFTDTLVNLAEAVGAVAVTDMLKDAVGHLQPLNRDLDGVFAATARKLGFDPSFPDLPSAFGFKLNGKLATIDGLTHAYTAHRLRQLGCRWGSTVFEIGGGYGCLALMARRAGVGKYAIFDLPWVNALQGYFLIRALPEGAVRLYGETKGDVRVLPYWTLADEPSGGCDGVVNTDSLPEMGRATAAGYLPEIRRVIRSFFLSINQESKAVVPGVGPQNCVAELVEECGGFATASRQRYWMRHGYVEEVYKPG